MNSHTASLDTKPIAFMKQLSRVLGFWRDKEAIASVDKTPLSPTPGFRNRKEVEFKKWALYQTPKIELPMLQGNNPRVWVRKCEKYSSVNQISDVQKMDITEMYLEGRVDAWYQVLKMVTGKVMWDEFKKLENDWCDVAEDFNKVHQESGDKYGFGHVCNYGHLNFMVAEEEDEGEFEEASGQQAEIGDPGQIMDIPLCSISDAMEENTIVIQGMMNGRKVVILTDTGSSHSYISSRMVRELSLRYECTDSLKATIVDGSIVVSRIVVHNARWKIHDYNLCFDFRVMGMGGWDIILGGELDEKQQSRHFRFPSINC